MKLEEQVCSLELSKKLKELRIKQDSLFYLDCNNPFNLKNPKPKIVECYNRVSILNKNRSSTYRIKRMKLNEFSAFTVAELGDMLPIMISINTYHCFLEIFRDSNIWEIKYVGGMKNELSINIIDKTEANARAKMLIYLIEKGFLKVGDSK